MPEESRTEIYSVSLAYVQTQQKIQVHYLMWLGTAVIFAAGVIAFLWDFARAGLPRATVQRV